MKRDARKHAANALRAAALPLCLLLVMFCFDARPALSQGGAAAPKWETVKAGGMSIDMPGKPSRQTQTVQSAGGPVEVHLIGIDRGSEGFMVSHNEFPAVIANALTDTKTLLDAGRDGALKNADGKLISERDLTLGGHPGREVVGEVPSKKTAFTLRVYWVKPHLYQVIYLHPQASAVTADGRKFLDSPRVEQTAAPAN
ncbi:MAG TPA: hypothetical protein VFX96_04625 [Pyrinomonadaceae bacterium]|nr:hypothetical protein [Pyrinomonadaceae bacterium]